MAVSVGKERLRWAALQFWFIPGPTGMDDKHLTTLLGEETDLTHWKSQNKRERYERKQQWAEKTFNEGHKPSCTSLRAWMIPNPPLLDACGWISQEMIEEILTAGGERISWEIGLVSRTRFHSSVRSWWGSLPAGESLVGPGFPFWLGAWVFGRIPQLNLS